MYKIERGGSKNRSLGQTPIAYKKEVMYKIGKRVGGGFINRSFRSDRQGTMTAV